MRKNSSYQAGFYQLPHNQTKAGRHPETQQLAYVRANKETTVSEYPICRIYQGTEFFHLVFSCEADAQQAQQALIRHYPYKGKQGPHVGNIYRVEQNEANTLNSAQKVDSRPAVVAGYGQCAEDKDNKAPQAHYFRVSRDIAKAILRDQPRGTTPVKLAIDSINAATSNITQDNRESPLVFIFKSQEDATEVQAKLAGCFLITARQQGCQLFVDASHAERLNELGVTRIPQHRVSCTLL